jgi:DNA-binding NtrC family response regulator
VVLPRKGYPLPQRAEETSHRDKRIFVVDDELDILNSMRILLGVWGIRVQTADSTSSAYRIFERHGPPDLVIIDLRLGDRLQQIHGHFPVLIITGETSSDALRQANERSYSLLQKPIAPEVLRQAIVAATATSLVVTP